MAAMSYHVSEDWQCSRRLVESNKYMLDNQIECDVTFTLTGEAGEPVYLHAHKFILISRSPVFFAMLSGPLAEKDKEIRITDIGRDIFRHILGYLYYEDVQLDSDNIFDILYTAKKYFITSLAKRCIEFLEDELRPENVATYLDNGFLFEDDAQDLYRRCMDLVRQHSNKVFHSDSFYTISRNTLCNILRVESLTIHEIDVFRACVHWSTTRCSDEGLELNGHNKRRMLGDAIKHIHFPTMSVNEFSKIVVPTGILSTDEENVIFRYILSPDASEAGTNVPFPTLMRECVDCTCVVTYDGFVKHTTSYSSLFQGLPQRSKWSISLYTDHTIKLKKISFLGKFKGSLHVSQNGIQKFEISCHAHMSEIKLEDDVISLESGLFSISTEVPFSYLGDYYSKSVGEGLPKITCDQDKSEMIVKDSTPLCFLASIVFIPSDEIHFVDNYFCCD